MELGPIRCEGSPLGGDRVRLVASVAYDTGRVKAEDYWFDVPGEYAPELSRSGNPWLACLLPLAAHTGEGLRVHAPVDRPLLENAHRLLTIWRSWYPRLSRVTIQATANDAIAAERPPRTGAFFSGGVDSFFTVLRPRASAPPAERAPVDDLITVWGFDVPLGNPDAFARLRERLGTAARELDKRLIDVATNLRATRWGTAQWSYLAHGPALASVALALEERFHTVYIAGGGGYRGLHPWGSHSVTDPLFSTWRTAITYDAVAWLRTEKIERIAGSGPVLHALRVCYEMDSDENCGRCNKCLRTMLVLDICGALGRSTAFPARQLDLRRIAEMNCSHFADFRELQDIRRLAVDRGRTDVVAALDAAARRSRRRRRLRAGYLALRHPWLVLRKHLTRGKPLLDS